MFKRIISGVFVLALATASAAAQKEYKIMGDKKLGSKFREVEATSLIPFNKPYGQLTAEQKELFRATYGGLADSEKPPFPIKGTQVIYKPIIEANKTIKQAGNLLLVAMVNEAGKVENVAVYESPTPKMAEVATTVLFNTQFEPASCAGEPCKMEFPFEFNLRYVEKNLKRTDG